MISLGPYFEILKETKGKSQQSTMHAFFKKGKILNQELYLKSKSLHYAIVKENQSWGITVVRTETFSLGSEHVKVMYKTLFF
jgi:hypothetical protein